MSPRVLLPVVADVPVPAARCDCRVCPFSISNPDAVEPVCSGRNTSCSYCGCSRHLDVDGCRECPIRCGSRNDIADWMVDVGGTLTFDDIDLGSRPLPDGLPRFVPVMDADSMTKFHEAIRWPAYALGFRRVFSHESLKIKPRFLKRSPHDILELDAGQLAVLVGYGEDPLVEGYWTRRHADRVVERIAAAGWDVVLAPNYSVYVNFPRSEQLLSMRRSYIAAQEFADLGVVTAPSLYTFRSEDTDRHLSWIADTDPAAVAVNTQTCRTDGDWDQMINSLVYIGAELDRMGARTGVLTTGASRPARLAQLGAALGGRLYVISQNPIQYARHGAVMTSRGREELHAETPRAFAHNVRFYAGVVDRAAAFGVANGVGANGAPPEQKPDTPTASSSER